MPFANSGRLVFAPSAQVAHLNRVAPARVLSHQRRLGSCWVEVCDWVAVRGRWLARPQLAPLAVAGRACALLWQLRRAGIPLRYAARHGLQLATGLCAWGIGVALAPRSVHRRRAR